MCFEQAINIIATQVSSPIAKIVAFMQQIRRMVPNFDFVEGEEIQDAMLNLILGLKETNTIENLYLDMRFVQDFIPENQWGQEHFVPCSHMIASITLILNDGVQQTENWQNIEEEDGESDGESSHTSGGSGGVDFNIV